MLRENCSFRSEHIPFFLCSKQIIHNLILIHVLTFTTSNDYSFVQGQDEN